MAGKAALAVLLGLLSASVVAGIVYISSKNKKKDDEKRQNEEEKKDKEVDKHVIKLLLATSMLSKPSD